MCVFFVSAFAVLSLFVSPISACACAYHQQKVETTPSCHVQSHSGHDQTAQTTDAKTGIDEGCTCFVFVPSPYVLAKSGKKKAADPGPVAAVPVRAAVVSPVLGTVEFQPQPAITDSGQYLSLFTISTPSRAPPRP